MTDNHPITPPPELVQQWLENSPEDDELNSAGYIATQAARWGTDQELEACRKWLNEQRWEALAIHLRAARRPKPPSLKEQALNELNALEDMGACNSKTIRRALEALPND